MHKLITQIGLLTTISSIALLVASCGSTKITECKNIIKVTKEAGLSVKEFEKSAETNVDDKKTIQLLTDMSTKMRGFSKEMQAIEIKDDKLKDFQSKISTSYLDYGKIMDNLSSAVKKPNKAVADKAAADEKALGVREKALISEFNSYCK